MSSWLLVSCQPLGNCGVILFFWWGRVENIKQAKGNECIQYKRTAAIFSSSLPICPVYFYLVVSRHVLSPCYARCKPTRGIKGYATYYLACYVEVTSAKHAILYEVTSAKHAWVSLEKIWMRKMSRIKDQLLEQSHRGDKKGRPKKGQKTNSP